MRLSLNSTLATALWPEKTNSIVREVTLAVLGTLLLTLSAKVQVPFYPVPLTLQTLAVLVLGAGLGWRLGAATIALYLAEGALGLPVFAGTPEKGLGLAYMMGPTGGFLAGFLIAAAFVGFCAQRGWGQSFLRLLAVMSAGHVLIFGLGFAWLSVLAGPQTAFAAGVAPFFLATVLKTVLAAAVLRALWLAAGSTKA